MSVSALEQLAGQRIVPVLTAADAAEAERAVRALLAGGLTAVEITFRTDAAAEAIRRVAALEGVVVGAGTVRSPEQVELAVAAGASFGVAPATDPAVIEVAREARLPFVPGAATPSEIERALSFGCGVVKLFPASLLGGTAFVRAVTPVFPEVRFLPTGGIDAANVVEYLRLPSVLACAGTWICDRSLLAHGRFDEIERRARDATGAGAVAA